MLAAVLFALVPLRSGPDVAALDALAQSRDVKGLLAALTPASRAVAPVQVVDTGGAYGVGRFGWHAVEMKAPGGSDRYVVLSTPLTVEDVGELLFKETPDGLSYIPEDDAGGAKVLGHEFDVRFDIPSKTASIRDGLTLEVGRPGLVFLRMSPTYRVDSVDGGHDFAQAGGVVALRLGAGTARHEIVYHGVVDRPRYAGSISAHEATLTDDYWYLTCARGPAPYVATIHAPKGWTAIAQGELVSRTELPEETRWSYRMDLPVVYFSLSAGQYTSVTRRYGRLAISCWSLSMTKEEEALQTELYAPILEFYERAFGPMPFDRYGAVVSPNYGGGALEAYSFATYGVGWLPAADAHEPSHTWWGGILPNTYLHSFWNEGFADFSMRLFERECPIGRPDERRLAFASHPAPNEGWDRLAIAEAGVFSGPIASDLGYGKWSYVLDALEAELGPATMERAMRRWIADRVPGEAAEWPGFAKAVDETTGRSYKWFFDQWVRRPGYPKFAVSDPAYSDGKASLNVTFQGEPYRMSAEVYLRYPDGSDELRTVEIPATASATLVVPARERPALISFDPYRKLVRRIDRSEAPPSLRRAWGDDRHFDGPGATGPMRGREAGEFSAAPADLDGCAIVGMPGDSPLVARLAAKAGFALDGDKLTWDGTTIDLAEGAAEALVDLGDGKSCLLALGRVRLLPDTGDASLALTDRDGRVVRARTLPKTSGPLVFKL